ncbi:MAG: cupredoxin domain-containing protein [Nanoarchaeota archaeon]
MKKSTVFGALSILVIFIVGYFVFSQSVSAIEQKLPAQGNVQIIKMYVEGGKYVLTPSTVTKGVPVRIEGDVSKMPGCSKSVVIPSFNVRKNLNSNDNTIEFTPDKAGTFNIACSMNMYKGTFTVLENDGSKSAYAEQPLAAGASCGGSGGGCGCGGAALL